jgi:uncharacterized coiled-coil protein SlyX
VGDFYDVAVRRMLTIQRLERRVADLEETVDQQDVLIVELRDELADRDRQIDVLEAATWRPHH